MDANQSPSTSIDSHPSSQAREGTREVTCDACGYPRTGIPAGARCPECGALPPELVDVGLGDRVDVRGLTERLVVTRGRLAWLRTTAVGLVLLLYTSYCALRVTLVMSVDALSLPAVNMPGPKLGVMAMLQRSLDGRPGPWGVAGTMAALGGVAAFWLLTRRQNELGPSEGFFSVRLAARWSATFAVGGMLGLLLSNAAAIDNSRWRGELGWGAMALLLGELPATILLYVHLYRLAGAVGDRRALAFLRHALWLVPGVLVGAAVIAGYLLFTPTDGRTPVRLRPGGPGDPLQLTRALMAGFGVAAVTAGAVATAGVGSLLATIAGEALGGWAQSARKALREVPGLGRRFLSRVSSDPARWCLVSGIGLWLWILPTAISDSLYVSGYYDRGAYGNVTIFNFMGPKVLASSMISGLGARSYNLSQMATGAWGLLALWLVTAPGTVPPGTRGELFRKAARWLPVLLIGAVAGAAMSLRMTPVTRYSLEDRLLSDPARLIAVCAALIEAPATALLYWHLANVAASWLSRGWAWGLRILGVTAAAVTIAPLALFVLTRDARPHRFSAAVGWTGAGYGALAIAVSCLAVAALVKLAWAGAVAASKTKPPPTNRRR